MSDQNDILEQHRKDVDPWLNRIGALTDVWDRQTVIWVGLANAAGLGVVVQKLAADVAASAWLLPSAWIFLLGLVAAGFVPRLLHVHFLTGSTQLFALRNNPAYDAPIASTRKIAERVLASAGGAFVLGVVFPLAGLTASALGYRFPWS
ncbi:hypothetical protein [Brevundimonas sp. TWP2-3-2]|uniref:hypothetical protein n=1 Tax=unclassified Brevundimonas TaxID=2622653 RepID=UPI003CF4FAC0